MIRKILNHLSKKASRKNLNKNILKSFAKIKNKKTKVLNILNFRPQQINWLFYIFIKKNSEDK